MLTCLRKNITSTMSASSRTTSHSNSKDGASAHHDIILLEDGWGTSSTRTLDDTVMGTIEECIKPSGLCISVIDISGSMNTIKNFVADGYSAVMATMNVIAPGIQCAVVCYNDFDTQSIKAGPVIRAPDCTGWDGEKFMNYLKRTNVAGGGKGRDKEALHSTLWYILNDMVPSIKQKFGVTDEDYFPVMIFAFTDEDIRMVDGNGNFPQCNRVTECEEEQNFFKKKWGRTPANVLDFKKALVDNNCWLRVVGLDRDNVSDLTRLCSEDFLNFDGYDNNRWQLFVVRNRMLYHQKEIVKFMIRQQNALFKNLSFNFSALPILSNMSKGELEDYMEGKVKATELERHYSLANIDAFDMRILSLDELQMSKINGVKSKVSSKVFLNSAYDTGHLNLYRNDGMGVLCNQQEYGSGGGAADNMAVVLERAQLVAGGGNAASCLALHMKHCLSSLDDYGLDYSNLCDCKGCVKALKNGQYDKRAMKKFASVQWAKMFAEKLFKLMLTEPSMIYTCSAIPADIGAIYSFVTRNNSGTCSVISKILSELGTRFGSSDDYKFLREGKHLKGESYDSLYAINSVLYNKTHTPSQGKQFLWFYLPSDKLHECQRFFNDHFTLTGNCCSSKLSLDDFKRFEHKACFDLIQKIVSNLKMTRCIEQLKRETATTTYIDKHRFAAIPVFVSGNEERADLLQGLADIHFDGRLDVAKMLFINFADVIPKLFNLLSVKLDLVNGGFASIKAVCGAAAWASQPPSDSSATTAFMVLEMARMALIEYVKDKAITPHSSITNDEAMRLLLKGIGEGEIENNLSSAVFLRHLIQWGERINVEKEFVNKLEHFLVLRLMANMNKNGIGEKYNTFAVREVVFPKESYGNCSTCNTKTLKNELVSRRFEQQEMMSMDNGVMQCYRCCFITDKPAPKIYNWTNKLCTTKKPVSTMEKVLSSYKKVDASVKNMARKALDFLNAEIQPLVQHQETIAASVAARAVRVLYGNTCLLYKMLAGGRTKIPMAVCVDCCVCGIKYKMSTIGPAKPQLRKCPWCRYSIKLISLGNDGMVIFDSVVNNKDNHVDFLTVQQAINGLNDVLLMDMKPEDKHKITEYFKAAKEMAITPAEIVAATNEDSDADIKLLLKKIKLEEEQDEIKLVGHKNVKFGDIQGPANSDLDGKSNTLTLQQVCDWQKFNTDLVEPWLGYRLDVSRKDLDIEWKKWPAFTVHANKDDFWRFLTDKESTGGLDRTLGLKSLNVEHVDAFIRLVVADNLSVSDALREMNKDDVVVY